jgi:hypothetical protein
VAYSPVLPLFSAQSGNASSPTVYPAYGGQVLVQIDLNSVTTATVTIEAVSTVAMLGPSSSRSPRRLLKLTVPAPSPILSC